MNPKSPDDVLRQAQEYQRELAARGWDWPTLDGVLDKIGEELREVRDAAGSGDSRRAAEELGDLLLAAVHVCNHLRTDSSDLLRNALIKLQKRIEKADKLLQKEGKLPATCTPQTLDRVWNHVKNLEF